MIWGQINRLRGEDSRSLTRLTFRFEHLISSVRLNPVSEKSRRRTAVTYIKGESSALGRLAFADARGC
jgi:hypothetical protein